MRPCDHGASSANGDILAGINFGLFLIVTGACRSEVISLRWSDVCIDRDGPLKSCGFADHRKVGNSLANRHHRHGTAPRAERQC